MTTKLSDELIVLSDRNENLQAEVDRKMSLAEKLTSTQNYVRYLENRLKEQAVGLSAEYNMAAELSNARKEFGVMSIYTYIPGKK